MALISCPECGRSGVSSSANACPGCGTVLKGKVCPSCGSKNFVNTWKEYPGIRMCGSRGECKRCGHSWEISLYDY